MSNHKNNFEKIRKQAGLTQREVAKIMGIEQSNISSWENGRTKPTIDKMMDLARIYNCNVEDLLKDKE